ncbi:hypothetical protein DFQ01_12066 [Paenibacillus cellulosilyticus]|uniref:Uncharacterized protein n=1 Tax=Paenibacillus cellulosilyticus TaxID=375489 RepID=A0A2V2YNY9_9BACL|nr:hypothetical protein [Paenibacillus cellulosilyticus]PWV97879.1 hypothetical protein DFQ01_12066 [Paenibacillus cellulosilyticus]QKS46950.1 hypothetical protein HUB94_20985 [Paenibacillus cellulosilyticus]
MSSVYLHHIRMKRESKSFVDSMYAILTAAGLFEGPKYRLSGLSGMAFKFTVHERLLPLSVTAYGQWGLEHGPAVDNLGLLTIWDGGRTRHLTFEHYQKDAVNWIKASLDRGLGVIHWIPEFGIIHGYDDDDGVFFLQDGWSQEDHIVLYDNLGLNFTPFWYVQMFGEKVAVPLEEQVLESARLAIHDWHTPFKTLPNKDIASGKLAYEFFIGALKSGDFDEGGGRYILDSYRYARQEIRDYLSEMQTLWPEIAEAYKYYAELSGLIADISFEHSGGVSAMKDKLAAAAQLEDRAIQQFSKLSVRYADPSRTIETRWNTHSSR